MLHLRRQNVPGLALSTRPRVLKRCGSWSCLLVCLVSLAMLTACPVFLPAGNWIPTKLKQSKVTRCCQGCTETAASMVSTGRRQVVSGLWAAPAIFSTLANTAAASAEESARIVIPQPPGIKVRGSKKLMPAIGFGTCCREEVKGPAITKAAKFYLKNGGRLIDTAQLYGNHKDLAKAIKQSGVPRDELWVTTKVLTCGRAPCAQTATEAYNAVGLSRYELDVKEIDLVLLHGGEGWSVSPEADIEMWQGLVDTTDYKAGPKALSVGVSNHNQREIERLITATGEKPVVNQIEFHPWVPPETKALVKWCQDHEIAVTAYGSLGGAGNKAEGTVVDEIAKKHGVSKAQVLLRWALDQGVAVIPGSNNEKHILENLQLVDVKLDESDARALEESPKPENFRRWHSCLSGCAA